jgi:hypothetical protein
MLNRMTIKKLIQRAWHEWGTHDLTPHGEARDS